LRGAHGTRIFVARRTAKRRPGDKIMSRLHPECAPPASLPVCFRSNGEDGMGPYDVAVAFWVFVAVAAVAGIVGDVMKRRSSLEPLRQAIQRGQDLDPKVVEALLARSEPAEGKIDPAPLQIGGIITTAAGIGVTLFSWFIAQVMAQALYPVMGAGIVAVCVGIGLVVAARVLEQRARKGETTADRAA
jgi:hypothetical protein